MGEQSLVIPFPFQTSWVQTERRLTLVVLILLPVAHIHPELSGNVLHSSPSRQGSISHHHFPITIEAKREKTMFTTVLQWPNLIKQYLKGLTLQLKGRVSLPLEFSCTDFIFNYLFGILCCLRQCTACHSLLTQEVCSAPMAAGNAVVAAILLQTKGPKDQRTQPLSLGANLVCTNVYKNKASLKKFSSEYSPGLQDFWFSVFHIKPCLLCFQDLQLDVCNHKSVQNYLNSRRL